MTLLNTLLIIASGFLADYDLPLPAATYWSDDQEVLSAGIDLDVYGQTRCALDAEGNRTCIVILNACLKDAPKYFREKVVLHEMAHYVDYMVDGEMDGHKGHWAHIMRNWDLAPNAKAKAIKACRGDLQSAKHRNQSNRGRR